MDKTPSKNFLISLILLPSFFLLFEYIGSDRVTNIYSSISSFFAYNSHTLRAQVVSTVPTVPTNFKIVDTQATSLSFTWTASTDDVAVIGYKIYRNGVLVGTSPTNSYTDTGLTETTVYTYRVSAYDGSSNESALSTYVMGRPADVRFAGTAYPVPSYVTYLGNPNAIRFPSDTNISDVVNKRYSTIYYWGSNGRLYLGAGNTSNSGGYLPGNSQPIGPDCPVGENACQDLWWYDTITDTFASTTRRVDGEVIKNFHESNGQLLFTSYDAIEQANFYKLNGNEWTKYPIPNNTVYTGHSHDVYSFGDKIFTTMGTGDFADPDIVISDQNGWDSCPTCFLPTFVSGSNAFGDALPDSLFEFKGNLYTTTAPGGSDPSNPKMLRIYVPSDPVKFVNITTDLASVRTMLPNLPGDPPTSTRSPITGIKNMRNAIVGDTLIYFQGQTFYSPSTFTFSLFYATTTLADGTPVGNRLPMPGDNQIGHYVVRNGVLMVLGASGNSNGGPQHTRIIATADLVNWTTIVDFISMVPVEKFDYSGNSIFLATIGDYATPAAPQAGNIYKIDSADFINPVPTVGPYSTSSNSAPIVSAGIDQSTTVSSPVTLSGSSSDDGLPSSSSLTVLWSKVSGVGSVTFSAGTSNTTNATFSAIGTYVLRLTATDGTLSSTDDVTVIVSSVPDTTPPSAPSSLFSSSVTTTSLSLSWTASTDDTAVVAYRVYRDSTFLGTTTLTSYTDSGLSASTHYSYTISAVDGAYNEGSQSLPLSVTTSVVSVVTSNNRGGGGGGGGGSTKPKATSTVSTTSALSKADLIKYLISQIALLQAEIAKILALRGVTLPKAPLITPTPSPLPPVTTSGSDILSLETKLTALRNSISIPLFTRSLSVGSVGDDVVRLRNLLASEGFTTTDSTSDSSTFTTNLKTALAKFQEYHRDTILAPNNFLRGEGGFGPSTRQAINDMLTIQALPQDKATLMKSYVGEQNALKVKALGK